MALRSREAEGMYQDLVHFFHDAGTSRTKECLVEKDDPVLQDSQQFTAAKLKEGVFKQPLHVLGDRENSLFLPALFPNCISASRLRTHE